MNHQVLVVDDEPEIRQLVAIHLEHANIGVSVAETGSEALRYLEKFKFDLVILDIMLEDTSGFELLQLIQERHADTPVILLSARLEDRDKVHAFELGALDYVTKPFSPAELVARVRARIRHYQAGIPAGGGRGVWRTGVFTLDMEANILYRRDEPISLTGTEYQMICMFMKHPRRVFTKSQIFEQVWGHRSYDENSLSVYINRLRRKIEDDPKNPRYIQTVWSLGYRFLPEVPP